MADAIDFSAGAYRFIPAVFQYSGGVAALPGHAIACELRSPAQFTEQGFRAFNESYVVTLEKWRLFDGKVNPVARSNVCPPIDPPAQPSIHAFSFTMPAAD